MKKFLLLFVLIFIFGIISSFSQLPVNGLIAWYPFNGNAIDSSGNNNNGITNGAIPDRDRFGLYNKAMLFNGSSDYITVANDVWSDSLTLSSWIYANDFGSTSSQSAGKMIFFKAPNTGASADYIVNVGYDNNNNARFSFCFGQNTSQYFGLVNKTYLLPNRWYMLTVTRANGVVKLYVNGNLDTTSTYSFTPFNQHYTLKIGTSHVSYQSFSGKMDDLKIYNKALSDQEINNLYNEEAPKTLLAWYPCDNNAMDSSGNNYHGIPLNPLGTTNRFNQPDKALLFNGNSDYVDVPSSDELWGKNISLSSWIYANDFGTINPQTAGKLIFFKAQNTGSNVDYILNVGFDTNSNARISFNFGQNSNQCVALISNNILQTNQWYFITATRENGIARLYVNGVLDTMANYSFTPENQYYHLKIGVSHTNIQAFNGRMDDLRIYNYALSSNEIDSLYHVQSTAIQNINISDNIVYIYPNPVKENLHIQTDLLLNQELEITNLLGQILYKTTIDNNQTIIPVSTFSKGIYFLKIHKDKSLIIKKFIKE